MYQNFYYSIIIWSSTCFGQHTAYHQEPKTALAASGFSCVRGCWTCRWWTLSGIYCAWKRPPSTRPTTYHASGFSCVRGCWTCRWWTLSGTYCAWKRPPSTRPTTSHAWKTRGCQCSFRLLMIGGVSPETCWASCKYGITKIFIHCCISLDVFLYELFHRCCRIFCRFVAKHCVSVLVVFCQFSVDPA